MCPQSPDATRLRVGVALGGALLLLAGCGTTGGATGVARNGTSMNALRTPAVTPQRGNPFGSGSVGGTVNSSSTSGPLSASPGTITKLFALTINGAVSPGEAFVLTVDTGTGTQTSTLCNGDGSQGAPRCTGNGEVITRSFPNLPPSAAAGMFAFQRTTGGGPGDTFFNGSSSLTSSATIKAYFNE